MNKDHEIAKALEMCMDCTPSAKVCSEMPCLYDFSDRDRLLLLEKMREREDWPKFLNTIGVYEKADPSAGILNEEELCEVYIILTKGALRDAAYEWLCKMGEN
jgi:hypothetical protein